MVNLTIDGQKVQAAENANLLDVARANGIHIPSLCHHPAVSAYGACRLCLVEIGKGGRQRLATSCNYPALDGLEVVTQSAAIIRHRKMVMELILAHCPEVPRLQQLAGELGVDRSRIRFSLKKGDCILCGLCERVCREIVGVNAISFAGRGAARRIATPFEVNSELCIGCGACVYVCPTDCIKLKETVDRRVIQRWGRELPMRACKVCGLPHLPEFQVQWIVKITGKDDKFFDVCPNCR